MNSVKNERGIRKFFVFFLFQEEGAASVEYAILASLIAAVIAFSVFQLGTVVKNLYQNLVDNWPS